MNLSTLFTNQIQNTVISTQQLETSSIQSLVLSTPFTVVDTLTAPSLSTSFVQTSSLQLADYYKFRLLSTTQITTSSIEGVRGLFQVVSTQQVIGNSYANNASTMRMWVITGRDVTPLNRIKYSYDAVTWFNSLGDSFSGQGNNVAWNGSLWVAVGSSTNTIKYSLNGINWSNCPGTQFSSFGWGVAYGRSNWVAVGTDSVVANTIKYSGDGLNWSNAASGGFSISGYSVAYNGKYWLAGGDDATSNNRIQLSYDGINWIPSQSGAFSVGARQMAWNGFMWVAAGADAIANNTLKYSYDGFNWSNSAGDGYTSYCAGVGWNGSLWVAWGTLSYPRFSYDGIRWVYNTITPAYFGGGSGSNTIWGGGLWLAVGNESGAQNVVKASSNGITWRDGMVNIFNAGYGTGVGYRSNAPTTYSQDIFDIQAQANPDYTDPKNAFLFSVSSVILNKTLYATTGPRTGINIGNPISEFQVLNNAVLGVTSTRQIFVSSISGFPLFRLSTLSSQQVYASSITIGAFAIPSTIDSASSNIVLALTQGDAYKPTRTTWNVLSDQRLKQNIVDANLDYCYDNLKQLRLRRFTYISSFLESANVYDKHVLGFIAQEVKPIVPKAIQFTAGFGFSTLYTLNTDQLEMIKLGALQQVIYTKEAMESTAVTLVNLHTDATARLSTLEASIYRYHGNNV